MVVVWGESMRNEEVNFGYLGDQSVKSFYPVLLIEVI